MIEKPVDFEGREFKVGDIFVSAQLCYRTPCLQKYKVEEITQKTKGKRGLVWVLRSRYYSTDINGCAFPHTNLVDIYALERCIITNSANRI